MALIALLRWSGEFFALRKGAALNAVQIAELLGRKHLQKAA